MSWLQRLLDPGDEFKRWRKFVVSRWVAFVFYFISILFLLAHIVVPAGFLGISQDWRVVGVVVGFLASGAAIWLSCLKAVYPPADGPTPEVIDAKIQKLKQDWEGDKRQWKENETAYTKRIYELEQQAKHMRDESTKPNLVVVSWPGYTIVQGFEDFNVSSITYVRGIDRATRFRLNGELPDILIVDLELYKLAAEHEPLLRLDTELPELDLTSIHNSMSPGILALKEVDISYFLPLRLGINALAFNKLHWKQPPTGYEVLFNKNKTENPKDADVYSIGIWNWYLPTMLVLLLAWGKQPEDVLNLDASDTQRLLAELRKYLEDCGFMSRIKVFHKQVEGLINDLEVGRIALIPAAGGWAFRPFGPQRELQDKVGVVVPKQGAFFWLEGAIVFKKAEPKSRYVVQFLKKLLDDKIQKDLCMKGPYGGCAVKLSTLRALAKKEYLQRRSDCYNLLDKGFTNLESNIRVRKLPKCYKIWEVWWDQFTEDCEKKYGAQLK